jgi:hypothetical protein
MKTKTRRVILEYREAKANGHKRSKWGFLFKTQDGHTLMESGKDFSSLAEAEQGFVSLMKSIATNQYQVNYPGRLYSSGGSR